MCRRELKLHNNKNEGTLFVLSKESVEMGFEMLDTLHIVVDETLDERVIGELANHKEMIDCHSGAITIFGRHKNLRVRVVDGQTHISGSLCKWHFGDNVRTLGKQDIKEAMENLQLELHLDMGEARVYRIDMGATIPVEKPVGFYLPSLGNANRYKRLELGNETLQYRMNQRTLQFYDKAAEMKHKKQNIPDEFAGSHLLRYELQYKKGIARQLKHEVRVIDLNDGVFMNHLTKRWLSAYHGIRKKRNPRNELPGSWKQMQKAALVSFVERNGGLPSTENAIDAFRQEGRLSSKEATRIKSRLRNACQSELITAPCRLIEELDEKIMQTASRFIAGESLNTLGHI